MRTKIEGHEERIKLMREGKIKWEDLPDEYFCTDKRGFLSPIALFWGEHQPPEITEKALARRKEILGY